MPAATTTQTIKLTMTYDDYTERSYTTKWQGNTDIANRIKAFNTAAADPQSSVSQTFLSENGAGPTAITDATTIIKTEEEIYHA